jgi:uncharacterized protein YrzB (UPF0473 family)
MGEHADHEHTTRDTMIKLTDENVRQLWIDIVRKLSEPANGQTYAVMLIDGAVAHADRVVSELLARIHPEDPK